MGDSSDSVSIDMETASLSGKDYAIETCSGLVSVSVYGDQDKPALVTYPDLALNHQVAEVLNYFGSLSNLLYYYGMCGVVKELLLKRYFSKEARGSAQVPESDAVLACKRLLDERQGLNVWRFLEAINGRQDISDGLRKLLCRSLVFVGENSPFYFESLDMTSGLDRRYSALVEVQACGSMVTQEQPHAMLIPMEYFLTGYRMYRPPKLSASPRSTLSPIFLSPELLTPESMGLKLKPIKTRISLEL
ncbi:hypothetical protein OIU77_005103 [Salix suchowensis]|uniref:Uncharacterized protein n=1 Tax=Salix suchowensis TaxID=1278906 RepID=A0ABQ9AN93_9ROSI|nr:hypothetical protein OIU77_005103 [Salix suchowensis]